MLDTIIDQDSSELVYAERDYVKLVAADGGQSVQKYPPINRGIADLEHHMSYIEESRFYKR